MVNIFRQPASLSSHHDQYLLEGISLSPPRLCFTTNFWGLPSYSPNLHWYRHLMCSPHPVYMGLSSRPADCYADADVSVSIACEAEVQSEALTISTQHHHLGVSVGSLGGPDEYTRRLGSQQASMVCGVVRCTCGGWLPQRTVRSPVTSKASEQSTVIGNDSLRFTPINIHNEEV